MCSRQIFPSLTWEQGVLVGERANKRDSKFWWLFFFKCLMISLLTFHPSISHWLPQIFCTSLNNHRVNMDPKNYPQGTFLGQCIQGRAISPFVSLPNPPAPSICASAQVLCISELHTVFFRAQILFLRAISEKLRNYFYDLTTWNFAKNE